MDFISTQKFVVVSPRKLREVIRMVKKMHPSDAVEQLPFSGKRAGDVISKVIKTALANAKQGGVEATDVIFKEVQVNEGPRLKRWKAGARGRAKPYKKRMSHIKVILTVKEQSKIVAEKKSEEVKTEEKVKTQSSKVKAKTQK
jgi:large subunit ribosomal protein L22